MEAICSTWEKPLVIGEDALNFGGGRTDEFLKTEKRMAWMQGTVEKEGGKYAGVFIE